MPSAYAMTILNLSEGPEIMSTARQAFVGALGLMSQSYCKVCDRKTQTLPDCKPTAKCSAVMQLHVAKSGNCNSIGI